MLLMLMVAEEPKPAPEAEAKAEAPPGGEKPDPIVPTEAQDAERLDKARQLLQEAIRRSQAVGPAPAPGGLRPFPGMKVDKYFGTKLPPVCASLGCYVTDDGKRFYCVNPACQKHKKRETKHTRRGNPAKAHFVYFRCPRCESRSLEMHVMSNRYVCRACKYSWQR